MQRFSVSSQTLLRTLVNSIQKIAVTMRQLSHPKEQFEGMEAITTLIKVILETKRSSNRPWPDADR